MPSHQPCPDCGSSDGLLINEDGSTKCFVCEKFTPANKIKHETPKEFIKGTSSAIIDRKLIQETCQKFKYNTGCYNGRPCQIATYRNLEGKPIFQKIRYIDNKEFTIIGKYTPLLYGMHLFAGNTKRLIITEGEIDCLSIYQVIKGYPVVSIPGGAGSASAAIKHNLQWLNKFEEIILCFDEDEAGQEAVKKAAPLLPVGKCKIMHLPLKDPNEMLKQNRADELYKATWNATEYRPDGIMSPDTLWKEVNKPIEWGLSYPWDGLTKLTYGIRQSELVVFGAGTGMGKTEFFKEIEYHLIAHHKQNVGIIHLEENAKDTTLGLMSKDKGILFHIPDTKYTESDFKSAFDNTIGTGRAFIYNGYGTTDFNIIENVIRYFAKAADCKYIFLDHITAFIDGIEGGNDVNQTTRNIILKLSNLIRELNINIHAISHLKKGDTGKPFEEGARVHLDDLYGSSALKQWASFVFGLERNQQAQDLNVRHTTTLRGLKDRYTGRALGETIYIKYNQETGKLTETVSPQDETPFDEETEKDF